MNAHALFVCGLMGLIGCTTSAVNAPHQPVQSLLEMRQKNVVMQQYDLSCGAAALATLLNIQFHQNLTEREVAIGLMQRVEYIQNPQMVQQRAGFSMADLKRYVQSRGYVGQGLGQLSLADLNALAPLIVPLNLSGYHHFLVVKSVENDQVHLIDPAFGHRQLSTKAFEKAWLSLQGTGPVGFAVVQPKKGE
jgi:uncharacterized protein